MPTTRKQKKARKSRGIEMLSDLENLDIMLGENHFNRNERDGSVSSNFGRRPGSTSADELGNNGENRHSVTRDIDPGNNADYGRNSIGGNSSAEINKLTSELNSRLSRELDDMMCSVNSQIQRAISDAISNQVLPQIQSALSAGSGHMTQNRWDIPSERPEINSEGLQNINPKDSSTSKHNHDHQNDGGINLNAYDTHYPRYRSRSHSNPSRRPSRDTRYQSRSYSRSHSRPRYNIKTPSRTYWSHHHRGTE